MLWNQEENITTSNLWFKVVLDFINSFIAVVLKGYLHLHSTEVGYFFEIADLYNIDVSTRPHIYNEPRCLDRFIHVLRWHFHVIVNSLKRYYRKSFVFIEEVKWIRTFSSDCVCVCDCNCFSFRFRNPNDGRLYNGVHNGYTSTGG